MQLLVGNSVSLSAEVYSTTGSLLTSGTLLWTSSAPAVAAVDAVGSVTAIGSGSTSVTATSGQVSGAITVTVPEPLGTVSAEGGDVGTDSGEVHLAIPANALVQNVAVSAVAADPDSLPDGPPALEGSAFEFGSAGLTFAAPATLTIQFTPDAVTPPESRRVRLHKLIAGEWVLVGGSTVTMEEHTASGEITSFSIYGLALVPNQPPTVRIESPEARARWHSASRWSSGERVLTPRGAP